MGRGLSRCSFSCPAGLRAGPRWTCVSAQALALLTLLPELRQGILPDLTLAGSPAAPVCTCPFLFWKARPPLFPPLPPHFFRLGSGAVFWSRPGLLA